MEISVISVQSVVKNKKKFTTDNTEIHGFKIHNLNKRKKISPLLSFQKPSGNMNYLKEKLSQFYSQNLFTSTI